MEYEGINSVVCDAEESDWLDVSYSDRYVEQKPKKRRINIKWNKGIKYAVVAVVCIALMATLLLLDGDFKKDVFNAVKTASTSVFNLSPKKQENTVNIPCNLTLVNVEEGIMTFGGGRAALSLTSGKVSAVTEDSVTISVDENTAIVYSNLTNVLVAQNDVVSADSLIGKYDGQFTASILQQGQVVKQVVGSSTQLIWEI